MTGPRTALVVADMQNVFVDAATELAVDGARHTGALTSHLCWMPDRGAR